MGNSCSCPRLTRRMKRRLCWCCGDCINAKLNAKENLITLSPTALETTTATAVTPTMATPSTAEPSAAAMTSRIDTVDGVSGPLYVRSLDFCLERNGHDHHTSKFEMMHRDGIHGLESTLVVRRGQTFKLIVSFNRPFNSNDLVSFIFSLVDDPSPTNGRGTLIGTALKLDPFNVGEPTQWACTLDSQHGDVLEILVKASVTAPIGEWKFDIDTQLKDGGDAATFRSPANFYLLFNSWCRHDSVYMASEAEREEYVLSDTTLLWRGSYNRLQPSVWKLGQYERHILECSLLLISTVGKIRPASRGDPVLVSRALSAVVNSPDDGGAILGNWSEDFSGGTPPTKWLGSVQILQSYFKKRKPVKYGQCWTFAGTLATIARAIGIPARIITTYSCAHDTQSSLTVDYFVDDNGKILDELNSDSIWNYHVWNELWMDRPDLALSSKTYGGWQAVDATPQEKSDGWYRCGPAPVRAVKMGEIKRPYDANFLYSEVNADKLYWRYAGPLQPLKLLRKDPLGIGHLISTKAVGKWEREDVTSSYKFPEKSYDERETMLKALRQANSAFSRFYLNEDFNDVYFDFDLLDDIIIGDTFVVRLQIKNRSETTSYVVSGNLNVDSVLYTGKKRDVVKAITFDEELGPNTIQTIRMEVTFHEYYKKLLDQAAFNISCMAKVQGTEFDYFAQDDFRVRKPDIQIVLQNKPISQQEVDVVVRLRNPLPITLRRGVFTIEGPGLDRQLLFKIPEVPVAGIASTTFKYVPPYAGKATFVAKFHSKELDDVDGFLAFDVRPRSDDFLVTNGFYRPNGEYVIRTNVID